MITASTLSTSTPLFTAGEVESRTGIPATTLRQWERRYGLPNPQRTANGYRLYSQNDLELIEFFKSRINEGISVSRAAQLYTLKAKQATPQPGQALSPARVAVALADSQVAQLTDSCLSGDTPRADQLLTQAFATMSVEEVALELIQPTLVEVGTRWHRGEITVAHEHQATIYLRGKLQQLLALAGNSSLGPSVVIACPSGEWHEIGALIMALFLRRAGIRTHYLGANTPSQDLSEFAREQHATAILLSVTNSEALESLRPDLALLQAATPLLVYGGAAFNENPGLARALGGVYAGRDAKAALEFMLERLGLPRGTA